MPLNVQVWILQGTNIIRAIILQVELCTSVVLLFTCCVTRAVHLELTTGVNSNSVILVLRRLIWRRGIPRLFISNNFKTFKSVDVKRYCNRLEIYIRTLPVVERVLWAVDINSKIDLEKSSLESVFILFRVVYRIDRDRKCIEFAPTDVFKWWNLLWKFDSIPYDLWEIIQR